ncbi:fumarylacetoacetate hydrolase family protein [Falsirhodobacter xinxiangensis]|uniref:fumarylacetoacetate hydrolase family protein n=1 Tax=Falsirhodobacter xinxiangensis TaxID=2530049 RepID=UPI0010AA7A4F|nr:fumarylacetoacetate hydrolase family protein [Rhodobacter xinxiangensis]
MTRHIRYGEAGREKAGIAGIEDVRLGACVADVGKFICVGLNYHCNARSLGLPTPSEPAIAMKPLSAICGPNDPIELPRGSVQTDWEVELGVVIGKRAKYVTEAEARSHIAGYCLVNDLSERSHQRDRGGDSSKGRGHDSFGPIGPWFVTADEIPDPQALDLWLEVDGIRVQSGNTADMIFGVDHLVSYISQFMTLLPGDLIATGTPAGIGIGMSPPRFLSAGQRVQLGGTGLGTQDHIVIASEVPA